MIIGRLTRLWGEVDSLFACPLLPNLYLGDGLFLSCPLPLAQAASLGPLLYP